MTYLSKRQVLLLHQQLIEATGGLAGLRDEGALEAALAAPLQTFDGMDIYPSLQKKAARLGFGLIKNHPFADGNKRVGAHAMLLFLAVNGIALRFAQEELVDIILAVASGGCDESGLLHWLVEHEQ